MKPTPDSRPPTPDSRPPTPRSRRGAALVMAMVVLLVVTLTAAALVQSLLAAHRQARRYADELQAQWLAEAGLARALAQLDLDPNYRGETWQAPVAGESLADVTIVVEMSTPKKMAVEAVYPRDEHRRVLIRRELTVSVPPALGGNP